MKKYLTFTLFFVAVFAAFNAFATTASDSLLQASSLTAEQITFSKYICKLRTCFLTNRLILTVCTIALSILAIMIMFGKVNWTMALVTISGIAILTGAYSILESSGIIPSVVPTVGVPIPGAQGTTLNFSTQDPCAATLCFNVLKIGQNL